MIEVIGDIIGDIMNANSFAWWVAGTLGAAGAMLVMTMSSLLWLSTLAGLFSLAGALTGIYVFAEFGIYLASDKQANAVLAATAGVVPAMLLLLLFVRMIYSVSERIQPSIKPGPVKL